MQVALDFAQQVALIKSAMRQHHPGFSTGPRTSQSLALFCEADIRSALMKGHPAISIARFNELMDIWRRCKISQQSFLKLAESEGRDEHGKSIRQKRLIALKGYNIEGKAIRAVELGRMAANSEGRDEQGRSLFALRSGKASAASVKSKLGKAKVCSALSALNHDCV